MHKAFKKNRKNNYKVKQLALHVKQNIQANQSTIIISNNKMERNRQEITIKRAEDHISNTISTIIVKTKLLKGMEIRINKVKIIKKGINKLFSILSSSLNKEARNRKILINKINKIFKPMTKMKKINLN
jgi:hypothetical protein